MDRRPFVIRSVEVTDISVSVQTTTRPEPTPTTTPQPPRITTTPRTPSGTQTGQGRVELIARVEQSGNPIVGVSFGVYRASDNTRISEITTNANGRASVNLAQGEYFLRNYDAPFGFLHERARIFFTINGTSAVTVDVTMQRDWNIPYVEHGFITLPQTGECLPIRNYVLGAVFITAGVILSFELWKKSEKYRRKAKSYA